MFEGKRKMVKGALLRPPSWSFHWRPCCLHPWPSLSLGFWSSRFFNCICLIWIELNWISIYSISRWNFCQSWHLLLALPILPALTNLPFLALLCGGNTQACHAHLASLDLLSISLLCNFWNLCYLTWDTDSFQVDSEQISISALLSTRPSLTSSILTMLAFATTSTFLIYFSTKWVVANV